MAQRIKRAGLRKRSKAAKRKKSTSTRSRGVRARTAKRPAKGKLPKKRAVARRKVAAKTGVRKGLPRSRRKKRVTPSARPVVEQVTERVVVDTVEEVAPGVVVVREYEFTSDEGPATVPGTDES